MVLESIINPKNAVDRPLHVLVISFVYSIISVLVAQWIFPSYASILTISFITILFVPFFQSFFEIEEKKEDIAAEKSAAGNLFERHKDIIYAFSLFFLGVILAMTSLYIFFPSQGVFSTQLDTLRSFSTGQILGQADFSRYFFNNTRVMLALFVMSFAFGAGAIFILAWNASVIAVYLGLFIEGIVTKGIGTTTAFLYGVPIGLSTIIIHGLPEVLAYFVAGLAGGVLSVGLIREKFMSREFKFILKDSLLLLLFAEFLISLAAYLEAAF
jgi:uncharacterized membrane protein SpoIIM required for sporulation